MAFDSLPGLLAASDIVVLALPLSAQSRSLIDAQRLAENLRRYLYSEPLLNLVDRERG